jgi:general stress protein 26
MDDLKAKIYEEIKMPQLMPMATITEKGNPWVRYVVGFAGEDLSIRFVTSLQTRKVAHIKANPEVHMTCGAKDLESTQNYLQIAGRAEITTDEQERHRLWNDNLKAYFSGPDDPNYCVVIVKPYRIELMGMTEMTPLVWEAD